MLAKTQQEYEGVHKLFQDPKEKSSVYQNLAEAEMLIVLEKILYDYRGRKIIIGKLGESNHLSFLQKNPPWVRSYECSNDYLRGGLIRRIGLKLGQICDEKFIASVALKGAEVCVLFFSGIVDSYYIHLQDNNGLVVDLKPPMEP